MRETRPRYWESQVYWHQDIREGGDRILLKFLGEVIKGIAQMPSELRNTDARSKGQGDHSKLVAHWLPSDYQGPRGTAPNDKSLKCFIIGAAPRNPMAPPLETPAPPLETPWRRASKPQVRRASKPLGTKFETKIFKFRWFLGPSDQNELYHTPLLSKIWDLGNRKFFGGGSL